MKLFTVEITEVARRDVEVKAEDAESAEEKVREMYRKTEIVLDHNDHKDTEFFATSWSVLS